MAMLFGRLTHLLCQIYPRTRMLGATEGLMSNFLLPWSNGVLRKSTYILAIPGSLRQPGWSPWRIYPDQGVTVQALQHHGPQYLFLVAPAALAVAK